MGGPGAFASFIWGANDPLFFLAQLDRRPRSLHDPDGWCQAFAWVIMRLLCFGMCKLKPRFSLRTRQAPLTLRALAIELYKGKGGPHAMQR